VLKANVSAVSSNNKTQPFIYIAEFKWKHREELGLIRVPCDDVDRDLFNPSTEVLVGNGKTTLFWTTSWIKNTSAKCIACANVVR
jgi:hypothetical protein